MNNPVRFSADQLAALALDDGQWHSSDEESSDGTSLQYSSSESDGEFFEAERHVPAALERRVLAANYAERCSPCPEHRQDLAAARFWAADGYINEICRLPGSRISFRELPDLVYYSSIAEGDTEDQEH